VSRPGCPAPGRGGGAAILMAFALVLLLAAGTLAASRNVARELALGGTAAGWADAAAAADSGLDWFRAYAAEPAGQAFLAGLPAGAEAEAPAPADQPFRVRVRNLGAWPADPPLESGEPQAAPPEPGPPLWLLTSAGRGRGGCAQVREALAAGPRPRLLAWWIGLPATSATWR